MRLERVGLWEQWYRLDSDAKVWLEDGSAGAEYEWGSLFHVREVFVASDPYEIGIELWDGGIVHTEFYAGRGRTARSV